MDTVEGQNFLAVRVVGLREPMSGCTKGRCSRCGEEVWVSPEGRPFFEQATEVICLECFRPSLD